MISNEMDPLVVNSGAVALDVIARQSGTLDMILMDITLGDMEGFDVIQTIRRNGVTTPVIIISGRNEDYDFMYGLSLGADDYVTKPFRPQILGAKVKALIRRSKSFSQENSQQISCGPFLCDTTTMRFYKNNVELNLSEKERSLLLLFVRHPQQVFTKDMIYEQIWGNLIAVDDNAIMVYINRLRKGWPLQADPTVKYALQEFGLRRILHRHLKYPSPYNTYINKGLPPSPICMPGRNAINAVLDFERHDYMFFCARPTFDGYHDFARTLREHNANARAYSAELNRRKIR